jgi:hypothetical protein
MGGSSSKPTVLECMRKHSKKGFLEDYGVKMSPRRLHMLCELEWPTFGVNWPPEVTLDLLTFRAIYLVIIKTPGHPISSPVSTPGFRWLRPCPLGPILYQQKWTDQSFHGPAMKPKDQKPTKPVLQGDPEDELPVTPLYIPR